MPRHDLLIDMRLRKSRKDLAADLQLRRLYKRCPASTTVPRRTRHSFILSQEHIELEPRFH